VLPTVEPYRRQETDSHTGPHGQQVSCAIPFIAVKLVTQSLCGDKTCESVEILRSKANSAGTSQVPSPEETELSGRPRSDPAQQGSPPTAREGLLTVVQDEPSHREPESCALTITPGPLTGSFEPG
jgi:hypothetical protein